MSRRSHPSSWQRLDIGNILSLEYGKAFPQTIRRAGPFAVYGSNGIIGRADKYLLEEATVIVGRKGSAGQVHRSEAKSWPIDTAYFVRLKGREVHSLDFVYYLLLWLDLPKLVDTTVKPGLNRDRVYDQSVVLPPLCAQARIVSILQKADEIRGKRQRALDLADSILSSSFIAMFGDPNNNGGRFSHEHLGTLADVKSGVTKGRKLRRKATVTVPYLRVANVQDGFLDLDEVKTIVVLPSDCGKYHLEDGDILMTEGGDADKLGRGCIWREEVKGCIHQNHVFRVRTDRTKILPEYLAALLRSQYAKHYFLGCAKRSSNLASVNSTQVKAFPVPVPPIRLQEKFVAGVEQWREAAERLKTAQKRAESAFRSLLHHAFTGELTAEFEKASAEQIQVWDAFEVQLPRMMALDVLVKAQEHAAAATVDPGLLVTAMMKLLFLIQMKGSAKRRFYQFVPYHYGPFAKELYADLEGLQADGLVKINNGDEDKTRITLADSARAAELTGQLPDELREDVQAVVEEYGGLGHNALLKRVYEEFPTYARKSRLRRTAAKKAKGQGAGG